MTTRRLFLQGSYCSGLAFSIGSLFAQDPTSPPPMLEKAELAKAGLQDAAFSRFIAIDDLREAYVALDVGGLVDTALQLHHAEDVFLRSHRSGIKPAHLLKLASDVAVKEGDQKSFRRLIKAARKMELVDLTKQLETAQRLAAGVRSTPDELKRLEPALANLRDATLQHDAEQLQGAVVVVPKDATDSERQAFDRELGAARTAIKDSEPNTAFAKLAALEKLTAGSRGISYYVSKYDKGSYERYYVRIKGTLAGAYRNFKVGPIDVSKSTKKAVRNFISSAVGVVRVVATIVGVIVIVIVIVGGVTILSKTLQRNRP